MDWLSVARLLVERGAPAVVVDRGLRVALVSPAFERLVGVPREEIEGSRIDDTCLGDGLSSLVVATLGAARGGGRHAVLGGRGRPIELEVDAMRMGHASFATVLLVVRSSHERLTPASTGEVLEYAVGGTLITFGDLRIVTTGAGVRRYWGRDAPRCHLEIYGAHAPCKDCPVLLLERRGADSGTFCAPRRDAGPERIATLERRGDLVHVRIERIAEDIAGPVLDTLVAKLVSRGSAR